MKIKERERIKNEINYRNVMTKRLGRNLKMFFILFLFFLALCIWGFSGLNDNFLQVNDSVRGVLKWIGLIGSLIFGVLSVMFGLSFHNSKKKTLDLIDRYSKK